MMGENLNENVNGKSKQTVRQKVSRKVGQKVGQTVGQFKSGKLAPKNLKPLIKEIPNRISETADQVLLGLSHTKQSVPTLLKQTLQRIEGNPNDIVGRVSRSVLERAEIVRKQLIEKAEDSEARLNKRWVPEWLKEASFTRSAGETVPLAEEKSGAVNASAAVDETASGEKTAKSAKSSKARASVKAAEATSAKPKKTSRAKKA